MLKGRFSTPGGAKAIILRQQRWMLTWPAGMVERRSESPTPDLAMTPLTRPAALAGAALALLLNGGALQADTPQTGQHLGAGQRSEAGEGAAERVALEARIQALNEELDRKSTRLNSSHVRISYAVFC